MNAGARKFEATAEKAIDNDSYISLSACPLTCYDRQADRIELIRTPSSELDLQHNEERQGVSTGIL